MAQNPVQFTEAQLRQHFPEAFEAFARKKVRRVMKRNDVPTFRAWLLSTASRPILTLALVNRG